MIASLRRVSGVESALSVVIPDRVSQCGALDDQRETQLWLGWFHHVIRTIDARGVSCQRAPRAHEPSCRHEGSLACSSPMRSSGDCGVSPLGSAGKTAHGEA